MIQRAPDNKKKEMLKAKINGFLIGYFNYLSLGLGAVILLAGLFLLVYPQYQQTTKDNLAAKQLMEKDYQDKSSALAAARKLKQLYQQISDEDKAKINAMIPVGGDNSQLISEIESIVVKNGAVLVSVKIQPEESDSQVKVKTDKDKTEKISSPAGNLGQAPKGVGRIKINIDMASVSYPVLKNIIKTLENNLRLMDVATVSYTAKETKSLLSVYAYYIP